MPSTIPEELCRFFERGLSIHVATRDGELRPDGSAAWAARVHPDRQRITVYLHEASAAAMLRNLQRHPEIAVLFERPSEHSGWQVKGRFASSRPAAEEEKAEVLRQAEGFREELRVIGLPRALTEAWALWPCVAIEFDAEAIFQQAPGPGSGERLK